MKSKWLVGLDEAGEKAWEAFARPCLVFSEYLEENIDKVYSSCKERAAFSISCLCPNF